MRMADGLAIIQVYQRPLSKDLPPGEPHPTRHIHTPGILTIRSCRFGDTAANKGIRSFLDTNSYTRTFPEALKTACASVVAGIIRMPLTPIDTIKTTYQAQGRDAWTLLRQRVCIHVINIMFLGNSVSFRLRLMVSSHYITERGQPSGLHL